MSESLHPVSFRIKYVVLGESEETDDSVENELARAVLWARYGPHLHLESYTPELHVQVRATRYRRTRGAAVLIGDHDGVMDGSRKITLVLFGEEALGYSRRYTTGRSHAESDSGDEQWVGFCSYLS